MKTIPSTTISYPLADIAKFTAAILVVIIHTHPFDGIELDYYVTCLCRIAVPFFFCISSFFFWQKKTNITKYIRRMGTLYLVWFLIELPLIYNRFFMTDQSVTKELLIFVKHLLFQNTFGASWYITASVQATAILWFLDKKKISKTIIWITAIGFYLLSCMSSMYYGTIEGTMFSIGMKYITFFLIPANSFMVALIYMLIGKYIAESPKKNPPPKNWFFALTVTAVIGITEVIYCKDMQLINDAFFALAPFTYFVVRLLLSRPSTMQSVYFKYFRVASTLVYFLHAYLIFWVMDECNVARGYSLCAIVLLSSLIFSYFIYKLSGKYIFLKYLY